ncbi:MAG: serine/threonine protein kinase [Dorea sp.]|jgi:serine/threonine protein kinase|nr:serine/threonine protein kinase [Dorea sp.]
MVVYEIDKVSFRLRTQHDLTWIKKYGTVFSVIDETGSGCISFGVANGEEKYFIKIAGADTIDAEIPPKESVETLKNAAGMYQTLKHPNLVELLEHYGYQDYYIAVFRWVEGGCLFDYWNFEKYDKNPDIISPAVRFKELPADRKLSAVEDIFSFLETVAANQYVAVDFYDGSLIYDFETDRMTICDIDLFRIQPAVNDIGEDYWGTKRLKAPEEYILGAVVDEVTNVYTLGAMLFDFFGAFTTEEIGRRYTTRSFLPCPKERWSLGDEAYSVILQAVEHDRDKRYQTIAKFHESFRKAVLVK